MISPSKIKKLLDNYILTCDICKEDFKINNRALKALSIFNIESPCKIPDEIMKINGFNVINKNVCEDCYKKFSFNIDESECNKE